MKTKTIKVGNVYLEMPDDVATGDAFSNAPAVIKAEKQDIPDSPAAEQYVFRPNDPFRAEIDHAKAVSSISTSHKPWVRKTWFILFVVMPLVFGELAFSAMAAQMRPQGWKVFIMMNMVFLPGWTIYYLIWRKMSRK